MKTEIKRFYSWHINYYNEEEVIIYKQENETENSYTCISQIIKQLLKEDKKYTFHLRF